MVVGKVVFVAIVMLTELKFPSDHLHVSIHSVSSHGTSARMHNLWSEIFTSPGVYFESNASDPLIYKRLRFDHDFLQIYRRYQKSVGADEHKESIEVNQKLMNRATGNLESSKVVFEYYRSDQVEVTKFTHNELVFEALDRAYLSRLTPAYVYNYDRKDDILKASDPRLVSRSKCDRELSFLMDKLHEIERTRNRSSEQGGGISKAINQKFLGFLEAFANEESGLLLGNYHWTGNWRECSGRLVSNVDRTNSSNSVNFRGRYCLAGIRSSIWDARAAERAQALEQVDYFRYSGQKYNYKRFHRVQVGICLPESCDSQIISSRHDDINRLATFKLSYPVRSYNLVDLYCLPDETSDLRKLEPAGQLFVFVVIVWLSLILLATYYDYKNLSKRAKADELEQPPPSTATHSTSVLSRPQMTTSQKLIESLSLIRNFKRLTETGSSRPYTRNTDHLKGGGIGMEEEQLSRAWANHVRDRLSPNNLLFLNFIKVLCMFMIVCGHTKMQLKQLDRFALNYDSRQRFINSVTLSSSFYVDLFLVVSSFLTTYMMFVKGKPARNSVIDWIYTIVHRYWRLAPICMLLVWFYQSAYKHTNSGPLWDYGSSNMTFRSICRRESFWYPLTLTANFHPIHQECIMPAWYISIDMQFTLSMPFFLLLLHYSAFLGWLIAGGFIVGCIALRMHWYMTDPHAQYLELMRPRADMYVRYIWDVDGPYLLPQYRMVAHLIGLLAGHYTYMVLSGKWKSGIFFDPGVCFVRNTLGLYQLGLKNKSVSSKRLKLAIFGVMLAFHMVTATCWIDLLFPSKFEPYAKHFVTVIYGHSHFAAGLGWALIITTMVLGQWELLRRFMSHPIWTVLSRLNYVLLVTQVEVINWVSQSGYRPVEFNNLNLIETISKVVLILYPSAVLLTLVLEQPLAKLEQLFLAPKFQRNEGNRSHQPIYSLYLH